jgi:hypothetical protein
MSLHPLQKMSAHASTADLLTITDSESTHRDQRSISVDNREAWVLEFVQRAFTGSGSDDESKAALRRKN